MVVGVYAFDLFGFGSNRDITVSGGRIGKSAMVRC